MWEEVGKVFLYVAILALGGTAVWAAIRARGKTVAKMLRETADVIDSFINSTASESEEGVKFSPAEWEDFKKQIKEMIASGKELTKKK